MLLVDPQCSTVSHKIFIAIIDICGIGEEIEETTFEPSLFSLEQLLSHLKPDKYIAEGEPMSFSSEDSIFSCSVSKYHCIKRWELNNLQKPGLNLGLILAPEDRFSKAVAYPDWINIV